MQNPPIVKKRKNPLAKFVWKRKPKTIRILTRNDYTAILPKRKRGHTPPALTESHILQIPENLQIFLSQTLPRHVDIVEDEQDDLLLQQATAPLPSEFPTPTAGKGKFYWKFALEMKNFCLPFHTASASRPWHQIKEELETQFQMKVVKQQKRNLIDSVFVAYLVDEWIAVAHLPRHQVYFEGILIPFDGYRVVQEEERIVVVRLPNYMAARIYKEVICLKFNAELTEEQRIEQLLNFNSLGAAPEGPPPHYRCHNCGKGGHWRKNCKSGRRMEPKGIPKTFLQVIQEKVDKDQNVLVNKEGQFVRERYAPP